MSKKPLIDIQARAFAAARVVITYGLLRPALEGVHVAPHANGGAVLTATDGHRLITIYDETARCSVAAVVRADRGLNKYFKRLDEVDRLRVEADGTMSLKSETIVAKPLDGTAFIDAEYPDTNTVWRKVRDLARSQVYSAASFNPSYLADFGKVEAVLSPDHTHRSVHMVAWSKNDPALVLWPRISNVVAVLMPMAQPGIGNALPSWMRPVLKPAPKSKRRTA